MEISSIASKTGPINSAKLCGMTTTGVKGPKSSGKNPLVEMTQHNHGRKTKLPSRINFFVVLRFQNPNFLLVRLGSLWGTIFGI
jgi:hypothetical protein